MHRIEMLWKAGAVFLEAARQADTGTLWDVWEMPPRVFYHED